MTCVEIYYEQPEDSHWLDAFSGDNGSIDPSTLDIHQVPVHRVVINHLSTHYPHQASRSEHQRLPQLPRRSSLNFETLSPIKLEHEPPVPILRSKSSIRRLYSTIRRHAPRQRFAEFLYEEGDSGSLATTATDSEYENSFLPFCGALPRPSRESSIPAAASSLSPSSSANHEPEWLFLIVAQLVSSKARKAFRALKKRFRQ
ncbi:uncharacterized protein N7500_007910 [Penicillium coprophilum]|uniref:uncharacterized protein n=1 Tax=Penicillium coprophilum TaxID=36646 RepID=UPI002399E463|nr:uncharacterized protein N7500_007910 [Penicillium coprophilum]KAJ5158259.1 hypothetical protein N7500_007910 [Penicillium coprophilum]